MQQIEDTAPRAAAMTSTEAIRRSLWIALVIFASVAFSFALACVTPFAALATSAALNMPRRDLFSLVGLAWLANRSSVYGFLGYPQTWDSFAWGGAIGIAACLGAMGALTIAPRVNQLGTLGVIATVFFAAFGLYEFALYAASFVLPGSAEAFSLPVVWRILYVNVIAIVLLLVVHRLALATGLTVKTNEAIGTAATA